LFALTERPKPAVGEAFALATFNSRVRIAEAILRPLRPLDTNTKPSHKTRVPRVHLHDGERSYFVTFLAFVRLALGYAPLLLKLGVCCKSLI